MNQTKLPLYDALLQFAKKNPVSFHVPGHKNGHVFPEIIYKDLLRIDATELTGLDDLHAPSEVIKQAQMLTAKFYGAKSSYFLVGGSTSGNLAMILSICKEDDIVLVQRDSHKSIFNALYLAGTIPVIIENELDEHQLSNGLSIETVKHALIRYPKAKALILTHPSYFGKAFDLEEIIQESHKLNIPVLVDEAHGAHFCLGKPFPSSALAYGADIVVHSAHKTLPAMTMGSFLHFNSELIDKHELEYMLQVLQSSSPSYPIMASLDVARHYAANLSKEEINKIINDNLIFREKLASIPQINVLQNSDPLKVIIETNCELTGVEIKKRLEQLHIFVELATARHVLMILPLAPLNKEFESIEQIKNDLKNFSIKKVNYESFIFNKNEKISKLFCSYKEMKKLHVKVIRLEEAVGLYSAMNVTPYPPGIPFLMKGERISNEHIHLLNEMKEKGIGFQEGSVIWEEGIRIFNTEDSMEN